MTDTQTSSYQGYLQDNPELRSNIYSKIPDQFARYESKTYNPFDFYTSSAQFNLSNINQHYREEQLKRLQFYRDKERQRMQDLNDSIQTTPSLTSLTLGQHLTNLKNTFFGIGHDLTKEGFKTNVFTKDNRLFYLGIFLLLIYLLYLILSNIFANANCDKCQNVPKSSKKFTTFET
jgi:hypothetical protein